jgi:hypothetical protein
MSLITFEDEISKALGSVFEQFEIIEIRFLESIEISYFVRIDQIARVVEFNIDLRDSFVYCLLIKRGLTTNPAAYLDVDDVEVKIHLQDYLIRCKKTTDDQIQQLRKLRGDYTKIPQMILLNATLLFDNRKLLSEIIGF